MGMALPIHGKLSETEVASVVQGNVKNERTATL